MSKFASFLSGNVVVVVVGGGAVAVIAVIVAVATGMLRSPEPVPAPQPELRLQDDAATATPPAAAPQDAAALDSDMASDSDGPAAAQALLPVGPGFDLVRVEPDGRTLVAGSGAAGAALALLLDGGEIGATVIDRDGKFVAFLDIPPSDRARVLSLLQRGESGDLLSDATVIIAPSPRPADLVAAAPSVSADESGVPGGEAQMSKDAQEVEIQGETTTPDLVKPAEDLARVAAGETVVEADNGTAPVTQGAADSTPVSDPISDPERGLETGVDDSVETAAVADRDTSSAETGAADTGTTVASEAASQDGAAATPTAPTVLMADSSGVTVLQAPGDTAPEVMSVVALDAITYSPQGEVLLSGRSSQKGFVRIYLDNAAITSSRIGLDGIWRSTLPNVDTGVYTLRVDEVNEAGKVTSRVETPFKREAQETVRAAVQAAEQGSDQTPPDDAAGADGGTEAKPAPAQAAARVVTVQPGSTLWAIASARYGEGLQYVRVFEANRDRIRDPDLIYPGQVFTLPED